MTTEPLPPGVDTNHLTEALRQSGALADGCVTGIVAETARNTILSRIIRLRLTYDRQTDAPASIIFKTGLGDRANDVWDSGRQEVAFYSQVAPLMTSGLVPRCFEAQWNTDTRAWHLLLEDLSNSHFIATTWPLPPTTDHCERIVEAWARLHAEWWDNPRLGVSVGAWRDATSLTSSMQHLTRLFERFADRLGDRLPAERRDLFERWLDAAPKLLVRYHSHRNQTIGHGDAHVWNCFLPLDGRDQIKVFDWDGWRIGLGSTDLAYMMALHWYPERRRRLERTLLDRYHATLMAHGVTGYDRDALTDDYRWSVLWHVMTPVRQAIYDIPPMVWWGHLERILLAVDDLGCRDLLT